MPCAAAGVVGTGAADFAASSIFLREGRSPLDLAIVCARRHLASSMSRGVGVGVAPGGDGRVVVAAAAVVEVAVLTTDRLPPRFSACMLFGITVRKRL